MEVFLFSLFNGVQYGLLLFMLSSGLTLIFSMMGVLNFAHASFYMLGAYFAYQISTFIGFWPALILAPVLVGTVGALVERYGLRVVHRYGHVAELLFTFGLAYVMEEVIQMFWGKADVPYRIPESMSFPLFNWQGLDYSAYRIFMVFISLAIFVALYGLLTRTRVGVIIRASLTVPTFIGFWPALILAPVLVGTVGALVERYGLRVVHRYGHVAELLFTFGLAYVMEEVIQMFWGKADVPYRIPESMSFPLFNWQGLDYSAYRIFMVFISLAIFVALYGLLTRTRVGVIIRASLTYPEIVGSLGHNVPLIFMLVFGFGSGLAGIAGVLGGNILGTNPAMALQLGPIVFVVIVIGGLGSLWGAFIASLFVGTVTNIFISYDFSFKAFFLLLGIQQEAEGIGSDLLNMTSGSISPVIPYLLLVLILITRPRGLFGTRDV